MFNFPFGFTDSIPCIQKEYDELLVSAKILTSCIGRYKNKEEKKNLKKIGTMESTIDDTYYMNQIMGKRD